jgi:type III secretory pathway component EscT
LLSVWSEDRIERLGAIGASVLGGAIGLAAALLLGMFCVDVATGFATRNARQFQLNELSMAVKNLAFASLLPILSAALLATVLRDLTRIPDLIRAMLDLFP